MDDFYKKISSELSKAAPSGWKLVWINAEVEGDYAKVEYDYKDQCDNENWFNPEMGVGNHVATLLINMRLQMIDAGLPAWSRVCFELDESGKFNVKYGYE